MKQVSKTIFLQVCSIAFMLTGVSSAYFDERESRQLNPPIGTGIGCGKVRVHPNQTLQIQSSNFGTDNYFNNEACTWTFTATECALSVYCPCFDIPSSVGCIEDHLKISHLYFQDKFCGENQPIGVYRANDYLTLRFKSDYKGSGKGFLCYIRCTPTGVGDPMPPNVNCPNNSKNPFGIAV